MTLEELLKQYKQHEVDFLLPRKRGDNHAYLDLYLLYNSPDVRWLQVQSLIFHYLNFFLKKYHSNKISEDDLLSKLQFPEVSYIALGHCVKGIEGRGTGKERAYVIKDYIFENEQVRKVGLSALANMSIAIGGLGPDLLSDMVANFGMRHLLDYTTEQVAQYGLQTREYQIDRALKIESLDWEPIAKVQLPFFAKTGQPRILVPRHLIRRLPLLTTSGFFDTYLKYFLREEEQSRLNSFKTIGRKPKVSHVTLKEIIEKLEKKYESLGEATRTLALNRPEIVDEYLKDPMVFKRKVKKANEDHIDWLKYGKSLKQVPTGNKNAHHYAETLRVIFTALYGGQLTTGRLDRKSEDGLYYYDVTFGNAAETMFFRFLRNQQLKSGIIIFEAKNYERSHVGNSQYNQAAGYTVAGGREIVFLVRRKPITEKDLSRARRHFMTHKVLILPLSDDDVVELLKRRNNYPDNFDTLLVSRAQKVLEA